MTKDKGIGTWQFAELERYLKEYSQDNALDSRTVFLANPKEKVELDDIILKYLWPSVLRGLGSSEIWIKSLKEGFPKSALEDENDPFTARSLTFLLEDPLRQISPMADVPWYCHGKIQCSVFDYMMSFDFYVYFPEDFSLKKIARLLKNPEFAGYPPELSYSPSLNGKGVFSLAFRKGSGAGWGLHSYDEAVNRIYKDIKGIIELIGAVYDLEKDYKSAKAFNRLEVQPVGERSSSCFFFGVKFWSIQRNGFKAPPHSISSTTPALGLLLRCSTQPCGKGSHSQGSIS